MQASANGLLLPLLPLLLLLASCLSCVASTDTKLSRLASDLLNRYTSKNGFDQLNTYVTSAFGAGSQNSTATLKMVEEFLSKPEGKRARYKQMNEAALQFRRLGSARNGLQVCQQEHLEELLALFKALSEGIREPFVPSAPGNASRRKLLKVFQELVRQDARLCLGQFQREWARLLAKPSWLAESADEQVRLIKKLATFQEETSEFACAHRFESYKRAIKNLECVSQRADQTLASLEGAWDVLQTLENIGRLRQPKASNALLQFNEQSGEFEAKGAHLIGDLLKRDLREPCERLAANEMVGRVLGGVAQFTAMLLITDDLFSNYDTTSDQLIKWTGRLLVCRRLLEHSDEPQLIESLARWARANADKLNRQRKWASQ